MNDNLSPYMAFRRSSQVKGIYNKKFNTQKFISLSPFSFFYLELSRKSSMQVECNILLQEEDSSIIIYDKLCTYLINWA